MKCCPIPECFQSCPVRGIESVTLGSCYGGSAEADAFLQGAPAGMVVQSMVGAQNVNNGDFHWQFAKERKGENTQIGLLLKALDTFDPEEYWKYVQYRNKEDKTHVDANPEQALPHMIGIGGKKPARIDLAEEVSKLANDKGAHTSEALWQRAIALVQQHFDTANIRLDPLRPGSVITGGLGVAAEKELHDNIAALAGKMRQGYLPESVDEKRIAYALTAAYMDQSGDMARRVALAKNGGIPLEALNKAIENHGLSYVLLSAASGAGLPAGLVNKLDDAITNRGTVTAGHSSADTAREAEQFAKLMRIDGVTADGKLTESEIKAIQTALKVTANGIIDADTMKAMNHAQETASLPTPYVPSATGPSKTRS